MWAASEEDRSQGDTAETPEAWHPVTPVQQLFLRRATAHSDQHNVPVLVEVDPRLDSGALAAAVCRLAEHHAALRLGFACQDGVWRQRCLAPRRAQLFHAVDLTGLSEREFSAQVEAISAGLQSSLSLAAGRVFRVTHFVAGEGRWGRLLVLAHHAVMDGVSLRILVEDLTTLCRAAVEAAPAHLPRPTSSYLQWASRLAEHSRDSLGEAEVKYWLRAEPPGALELPVDRPGAKATVASLQPIHGHLGVRETSSLLQDAQRRFRTRPDELLLTALARSLTAWAGRGPLFVEVTEHGRDELFADLDLSRTVGWFATARPLWVEVDPAEPPLESLRSVQRQLRRCTASGLTLGMARFGSNAALRASLADLPTPLISFNYVGQFGSHDDQDGGLFRPAEESFGPNHYPLGELHHRLIVTAKVEERKLFSEWFYSRALYRRDTIKKVFGYFMSELGILARAAQSPSQER